MVALRLVPPDSLERRLADADIDGATAYTITVRGYTLWHDRGFAHVGRRTGASFRNESSPTIRLDVAHGGFCEAATCTPEDPGLTYIRTEHSHGYVVRRGQVDVRVMALAEADRTLLRQAALSARPATDAELLRGLPPWTPDDAGARFHRWLHSF
ncbi:hypothetical protein [Nonomuraea sp. NPDC050202]|uniref:hypothetical protein n=1 Tax=Nonomuraea sp. NPDC050202 TaxID=3155035 RepID=UPI0033C9A8AA